MEARRLGVRGLIGGWGVRWIEDWRLEAGLGEFGAETRIENQETISWGYGQPSH